MFKKAKSNPVIGISTNQALIETGSYIGRQRAFVVFDYIRAITAAGGIPILLPNLGDIRAIEKHLDLVDGILLSGGNDIQPHRFGEEPHKLLGDTCPERDEYEISLAKLGSEQKKPILGICRGHQILNVAFGGTLYQDIAIYSQNAFQHSQKDRPEQGTHTVQLLQGTRLHGLCQADAIQANSFHHQAIKDLAPGFIINAIAKDGVIEGIEKMDHSFILGVQWHPEFMIDQPGPMLAIFKAFVEAAQGK